MLRLFLALALVTAAHAQTSVVGEGGGGASDLDALTDVTITTATTDDVLKYDGSGWVNKNLLTAIGEDLTSGRIPFVSGGALTDSAVMDFDGSTLRLLKSDSENVIAVPEFLIEQGSTGAAYMKWLRAGVYEYSAGFAGGNDNTWYLSVAYPGQPSKTFISANGGVGKIYLDGSDARATANPVFTATSTAVGVGANNTAPDGDWSCRDATATVGDTLCVFRGGPGETGSLTEWQDNAGNVLGKITSDGYGVLPAVQLADPGTKPACSSDTRGMIWYDAGGAGVADTAEICGKDASDVYAWVAIATF